MIKSILRLKIRNREISTRPPALLIPLTLKTFEAVNKILSENQEHFDRLIIMVRIIHRC